MKPAFLGTKSISQLWLIHTERQPGLRSLSPEKLAKIMAAQGIIDHYEPFGGPHSRTVDKRRAYSRYLYQRGHGPHSRVDVSRTEPGITDHEWPSVFYIVWNFFEKIGRVFA